MIGREIGLIGALKMAWGGRLRAAGGPRRRAGVRGFIYIAGFS